MTAIRMFGKKRSLIGGGLAAGLVAALGVAVPALTLPNAVADPASGGTVLLSETFRGSGVTDPKFVGLDNACLTGAGAGSAAVTGNSNLSNCDSYQVGVVPSQGTGGDGEGWLQLTDASGGNLGNQGQGDSSKARRGGLVYNQALPASNGIHVQFEQAQYGGFLNAGSMGGSTDGSLFRSWGADGISFFLTDGAENLTNVGAYGGSLGYAQKSENGGTPGVAGGFLGLGLDAWGNYTNNGEGRGNNTCSGDAAITGTHRDSIVLRGPGAKDGSGKWMNGYCVAAQTQLLAAQGSLRQEWDSAWPWNKTFTASEADAFAEAATRWVDIEVSPAKPDNSVDVTIQVKFSENGAWITVLSANLPNVPDSYKFGLAASTGNAADVHLVRNLTVKTVDKLDVLNLNKDIDSTSSLYKAGGYNPGDKIPYVFEVKNNGLSNLHGVVIEDAALDSSATDFSCTIDGGSAAYPMALASGKTAICKGGYHTLTAAEAHAAAALDPSDANYKKFPNTATAKGYDPTDVMYPSDPDDAKAPVIYNPKVEVRKTATVQSGNSPAQVGDVINYSFEVRNTGNVDLAPVTVTDPKAGLTTAQACVSSLPAGADWTVCSTTATHTVTEADILAGSSYINEVTASGTPAGGGNDVTDEDDATVPLVSPATGIEVQKSATWPGTPAAAKLGDTINYSFKVRNTGNVTLAPVTITDPNGGISTAVQCVASLAPSTTWTDCDASAVGTHTVTEADILAGHAGSGNYSNTVTATGTPPSGSNLTPPTNTGDHDTPLADPTAGITVSKDAAWNAKPAAAGVGDTITYSFTVTNTGNTTLAPVTISDPKGNVPAGSACVASLAPGDTATCSTTGTHIVSQADLGLAGSLYLNTVMATGTPPAASGLTDVTNTDNQSVPVTTGVPGLKLTKVASVSGADAVADLGETITYSFIVENTGNVTLSPVTITDSKLGLAFFECAASLDPTQTVTCQAPASTRHVVTPSDIAKGSVDNTATAHGTSVVPGVPDPTDPTSDANVPTAQANPAIDLVKKGTVADTNGNGITGDAGDVVSYAFTVTNVGNVDLTNVTISDPKLGVTGLACAASLQVGDSATCASPKKHTLTDADVVAGSYTNTATATAVPPAGGTVTDGDDETVPTAQAKAALAIVKTATLQDSDGNKVGGLGEKIRYTFAVTNTGTVTLTDVKIDDTMIGGATCEQTTLAPGAATTCKGNEVYVITAKDVTAGKVVNVATATATPPQGVDDPKPSTDTAKVDTKGGTPANGGTGGTGGKTLPKTGSNPLPWVGGALALILTGGALVIGRKRWSGNAA
ncbi:DUF7507 domain-containing protein [Rarobacter incanus]|uniref:Putative repeat protein (TIGR01451 family) n=1 Tax=Rarobacter incanus TaxID=153494 RepID=A0A542SPE8_9MICO|nr:hypothetical protein [Rarobacter incanus]TQK76493.1 putative repeat protein (TIGR01451 family) [Rarobacter incanus]